MVRKINRKTKIQIIGGQAKPGSELASIGVNMGQLCTSFNEKTQNRKGEIVPVIITIFNDKSFELELKTTPVSWLLKKTISLEKGSSDSRKTFVGEINMEKIRKIAEYKIIDFNTNEIEAAMDIVIGTAKSMGIKIVGTPPIIKGKLDKEHSKKIKINKQFRLLKIKKVKAVLDTNITETKIESKSIENKKEKK